MVEGLVRVGRRDLSWKRAEDRPAVRVPANRGKLKLGDARVVAIIIMIGEHFSL